MRDRKEVMQDLVDRAIQGKQSDFQLLTSWKQYFYVKKFLRSTWAVWRNFKKIKRDIIKKARAMISDGGDPIAYVIALKEVSICLKFYSAEIDLAYSMTDEWAAYLLRGLHFIDSLIGIERKEEDMYDHRKI